MGENALHFAIDISDDDDAKVITERVHTRSYVYSRLSLGLNFLSVHFDTYSAKYISLATFYRY